MNVNKTKIIEIGKTKYNIRIVAEGKSEEQVQNFKYLSVMLSTNGAQEIKIKIRLVNSIKVFK